MVWYMLTVFLLSSLPAQGGRLMLAGGGIPDNNNEMWDKVVEMAGGVGVARIGVVTAASGDPVGSWDFYGPLFEERGAVESYWIPVHLGNTEAAYDPVVVNDIGRLTGFFFGGGDQARIIQTLFRPNRTDTPVLAAIRSRWAENPDHMIGGTSAGCVALTAAPMIMDGWSWDALVYGAFEKDDAANPPTNYVLLFDGNGGIGFNNKFVLDSHYSERGREGRLMRLAVDTRVPAYPTGTPYAIGVDENTALLVYDVDTPSAYGEVFGENGVMFIDVTESIPDDSGDNWRIDDVIMHYLTPGDSINLDTLSITQGPDKTNIQGQESLDSAPTSDIIFEGEVQQNKPPEFVRVATGLFDCASDTTTFGTTELSPPQYTVEFSKTDFRAAGFLNSVNAHISYEYLVTMFYATP